MMDYNDDREKRKLGEIANHIKKVHGLLDQVGTDIDSLKKHVEISSFSNSTSDPNSESESSSIEFLAPTRLISAKKSTRTPAAGKRKYNRYRSKTKLSQKDNLPLPDHFLERYTTCLGSGEPSQASLKKELLLQYLPREKMRIDADASASDPEQIRLKNSFNLDEKIPPNKHSGFRKPSLNFHSNPKHFYCLTDVDTTLPGNSPTCTQADIDKLLQSTKKRNSYSNFMEARQSITGLSAPVEPLKFEPSILVSTRTTGNLSNSFVPVDGLSASFDTASKTKHVEDTEKKQSLIVRDGVCRVSSWLQESEAVHSSQEACEKDELDQYMLNSVSPFAFSSLKEIPLFNTGNCLAYETGNSAGPSTAAEEHFSKCLKLKRQESLKNQHKSKLCKNKSPRINSMPYSKLTARSKSGPAIKYTSKIRTRFSRKKNFNPHSKNILLQDTDARSFDSSTEDQFVISKLKPCSWPIENHVNETGNVNDWTDRDRDNLRNSFARNDVSLKATFSQSSGLKSEVKRYPKFMFSGIKKDALSHLHNDLSNSLRNKNSKQRTAEADLGTKNLEACSKKHSETKQQIKTLNKDLQKLLQVNQTKSTSDSSHITNSSSANDILPQNDNSTENPQDKYFENADNSKKLCNLSKPREQLEKFSKQLYNTCEEKMNCTTDHRSTVVESSSIAVPLRNHIWSGVDRNFISHPSQPGIISSGAVNSVQTDKPALHFQATRKLSGVHVNEIVASLKLSQSDTSLAIHHSKMPPRRSSSNIKHLINEFEDKRRSAAIENQSGFIYEFINNFVDNMIQKQSEEVTLELVPFGKSEKGNSAYFDSFGLEELYPATKEIKCTYASKSIHVQTNLSLECIKNGRFGSDSLMQKHNIKFGRSIDILQSTEKTSFFRAFPVLVSFIGNILKRNLIAGLSIPKKILQSVQASRLIVVTPTENKLALVPKSMYSRNFFQNLAVQRHIADFAVAVRTAGLKSSKTLCRFVLDILYNLAVTIGSFFLIWIFFHVATERSFEQNETFVTGFLSFSHSADHRNVH